MANTALVPNPLPQLKRSFDLLPAPGLKNLLHKGLQRGILAEFTGTRSSGKTSVCLHLLAQATQRGEICAIVDLHDRFYPAWAADAGVALDRVVWIRCKGNAEHALRAADLLLHAGGFGIVLLDICDASPRILNRIPLSYWYRFRRAVENTPTVFLLCADKHHARAASVAIEMRARQVRWSGNAPFRVIRGIEGIATSLNAHPVRLLLTT
jgi:hypothetical protein